MKRFAIDVVILPPENVMGLAIEHNKRLLKTHPVNIVLGRVGRLPHISLAMGCLAIDLLETAKAVLQEMAHRHPPLELHVTNIHTVKNSSGNRIVSFDIDLQPGIAALHKSIVSAFDPLLTNDATAADLNDPPPIEASSLEWINRFIPHSCFENFWPHITLGFGDPPEEFKTFSFQASRLAICHLGNYCTCTTILGEASLNEET